MEDLNSGPSTCLIRILAHQTVAWTSIGSPSVSRGPSPGICTFCPPTPGFLVQVCMICGVIGTKWSAPDIWEHAGSQEAGLTLASCVTLNQSLTVSGPYWFWSLSIFASKHQPFEKFISWDWTQARNPVLTLEYTTHLVISMAERSCTQRGVMHPWRVFIRCVCQP